MEVEPMGGKRVDGRVEGHLAEHRRDTCLEQQQALFESATTLKRRSLGMPFIKDLCT